MSDSNLGRETQRPVTVSVVSHGHAEELSRLLPQLAEHSARHIAVVAVTLNRPEPALRAFVSARSWPFEIRVKENERPLGFGENHNRAFLACETTAFCVINPDIQLFADPLAALLDVLARGGQAGCAYPPQQTSGGRVQDSQRTLPTPARVLLRGLLPMLRRPAGDDAVDWVNGAFMLFDSKAFAAIGGFDPRYFMYGEDVDICLRLQLAGYGLVRGGSAVVHDAHRASHARLRHLTWHLRSLLLLWTSGPYREYKALRRGQRA